VGSGGTTKYVLLLNNDTIVTAAWLTRMLRAMESDPAIGMVGPVSNFVSGPQQIAAEYESRELTPARRDADGFESSDSDGRVMRIDGRPGGTVFCDLGMIDEFARRWGEANDGRIVEVPRLVGFCLLIRREVIDRIGLLDERFGIGNFEDDDYCRRARDAGFKLAIAADAFVHHFGGRTFIGSGVNHGELMRRNERLYREKWEGRKVIGDRSSVTGAEKKGTGPIDRNGPAGAAHQLDQSPFLPFFFTVDFSLHDCTRQ
jgi:GT2 family glycosyltransferase